ncbi:hypothetical protein CMV_020024 [Castanea mollissima]|uniref:Anaphase-promoting complex subunit 2 TPR repeats domain-containing protein n=1 Tax=Castanea mollissima TaxID=60419 RepID=A0A8J4VM69_9ROSI|nr:hypothetical protein CMV_020024 [Castanea mollissima]
MATEGPSSSSSAVACILAILDSLTDDSIRQIHDSYTGFCATTATLLTDAVDLSVGPEFIAHVHSLCHHGLHSPVRDHFLKSLEEIFEQNGASKFWRHFDAYTNFAILSKNQPPICESESYKDQMSEGRNPSDAERSHLFSKYQLLVSSVLMASLPRHFPEILHWYFKGRLEELSTIMGGEFYDDESQDKDEMDLDEKSKISYRTGEMDIDECSHQGKFLENNKLVKNIGKVVRDLRSLGFTSMTEDAYSCAIFLLLNSIKGWIQAVPLQFFHALLAYLGDSLRLEYFAYETLQDLRIAKLFEIIVDYPDSSTANEDLKQCLEYTGQHSKLVESFISAPQYRLLTAGASTNDILCQYVPTIKALRTIDPAGVFVEAVGEPIRDYLRGRKDTIKCIVTMLTDGTGGNPNVSGNAGDSLLEELNKDEESQENTGVDDDFITDDKQACINAACWEPDPIEADPSKGSRNWRKVDILGMIVGIIGSKDQLVNEYRVMLAEKLLNKSDYDIDSEIRTLELLKIHFGESSMQKCDTSSNLMVLHPSSHSMARLELQFEDRAVQFTVAPVHAAIIMQFQDQTSWTSKNLAAAIGLPVDVLNRRINFWISKGILEESLGADSNDHVFALMEGMVETNKNGGNSGSCEEILVGDDKGERSVASVEDQIRKDQCIFMRV